jgi:hypothetical protein
VHMHVYECLMQTCVHVCMCVSVLCKCVSMIVYYNSTWCLKRHVVMYVCMHEYILAYKYACMCVFVQICEHFYTNVCMFFVYACKKKLRMV